MVTLVCLGLRELPERWALVRRAVLPTRANRTTTFGLLLLLLSWLAIWFGHTSVLALIIGILVLDLTVQGVHITNQTVIYRIHPDARNRLTAGYMTSYFIGGAAGSLISA